jgi:CRP-like cAMP-binding protein
MIEAMKAAHRDVAMKCAFLRGLSAKEGKAFLATGSERRISADTFLLHQGEPATVFYILIEGIVRLSQITPEGHQIIIHHVTPGEGIGIIVALSQVDYPVSAETLEDCLLLCWDAPTTKHLMLRYPQLAINGMEMVAQHFVQVSARYRELATERVERRISHAILRLVRQVGKKSDEGILIDIPLSRQDLAEMTGTTLYTTSRVLSQWEKNGWIKTGREQVTLLQPHELVAIAEDLPPNSPVEKMTTTL